MRKFIFSILTILFISTNTFAQMTEINGQVLEKGSNDPLSFATIRFEDSDIGTTTDIDGFFKLSTENTTLKTIEISYLGFDTKTERIKTGKAQTITIKLKESAATLDVVTIKAKRKVKKDPAAIALYKRVIKNKDKNQPKQFDGYSYEEYAKSQFDLYNIKEKLTKRKILKPINFIFENMDTTDAGVAFLPLLLKEQLSEVYYQKDPNKNKRILRADQFSGVDNDNLSQRVDVTFPEIDIYANNTELGGKVFVSPFGRNATITYKYFLTDSTFVEGQKCYKLEFTPRRKGDLGYTGHAWVDSTSAALQSVDLYVLDQINVNYLTGLTIRQEFAFIAEHGAWFKNKERLEVSLNLTENKKHQAVRIVKNISVNKITINPVFAEDFFDGDMLAVDEDFNKKDNNFWASKRHEKLNDTEQNIYTYVERVKDTKAYKVGRYLGQSLGSGWFNAGPIEFGQMLQFYSRNALEGNRYKLGLRTNPRQFRDKFLIEGHIAYGDKDKLFKYALGANVHLKRVNRKWHMIGGHYRFDWSDFSNFSTHLSHDHMLISLLRPNPMTNLFLIRQGHLFYEKEWIRGLTNKFTATHKTVYEWPDSYQFNSDFVEGENPTLSPENGFQAFELSVNTRWGLGDVFRNFAGGFKREQVDIRAPVLNVQYTVGIKNFLGSDYGYHTIGGSFSQRINTKAGRSYYTLKAEKTFGKIPYPLLHIHSGNRSYLFNRNSYNMMNDREFVNDAFIGFDARHHFDGFLFNMIPYVSRLKMRSVVMFKSLYGTLSQENADLIASTDTDIRKLNGFYAEAGVGVENILKCIHIYGVYRLTEQNDPTAQRWGIKFYFSPSF